MSQNYSHINLGFCLFALFSALMFSSMMQKQWWLKLLAPRHEYFFLCLFWIFLSNLMTQIFSLILFSVSFVVLTLTCSTMIHFKLIFTYNMTWRSVVFLICMSYCHSTTYWKDYSFSLSPLNYLGTFVKTHMTTYI